MCKCKTTNQNEGYKSQEVFWLKGSEINKSFSFQSLLFQVGYFGWAWQTHQVDALEIIRFFKKFIYFQTMRFPQTLSPTAI
jgi:hypothetical protein